MFDAFMRRHPPKKPGDPSAFAQFQAHHARLSVQINHCRPWTQDEAIALGRLFVLAWGRGPRASEIRRGAYLPYPTTLKRLFGSLAAYGVALQRPVEACGCTTEPRCMVAHRLSHQWQQGVIGGVSPAPARGRRRAWHSGVE